MLKDLALSVGWSLEFVGTCVGGADGPNEVPSTVNASQWLDVLILTMGVIFSLAPKVSYVAGVFVCCRPTYFCGVFCIIIPVVFFVYPHFKKKIKLLGPNNIDNGDEIFFLHIEFKLSHGSTLPTAA